MQCNRGEIAMSQTLKDSILQDFSRNPRGQLCIHFTDPAYVRSDLIIFDRKDSSLHAVLEGTSHFVGYAGPDLARNLHNEEEVVLAAPHYFSGVVKLSARIAVN